MLETGAALVLALGAVGIFWYFWPQPAARVFLAADRQFGRLRSRRLTVDDIDWHYLEGGRGEPLVLLHGFNADAHHFARCSRHLTQHFRVLAPDLPGFGLTGVPEELDYRIEAQARRVASWLDAMGVDRCYLGGNSMGGYTALMLACHHPERVRALWLLAPGGLHTAPYSPLLETVAEGGHNRLIVRHRADFDRLLSECFVRVPWIPEPLRRHLAQRAAGHASRAEGIFEAMRFHSTPLEEFTGDIEIPAWIVWGEQDRVLHPAGLELLAGLMPSARTRLMADTGHLPMLEKPALTAREWTGFVESMATRNARL